MIRLWPMRRLKITGVNEKEVMHSVYLCGGRERLDQLSSKCETFYLVRRWQMPYFCLKTRAQQELWWSKSLPQNRTFALFLDSFIISEM